MLLFGCEPVFRQSGKVDWCAVVSGRVGEKLYFADSTGLVLGDDENGEQKQ